MVFKFKTDFKTRPPRVFQRKKGGNYYMRQHIGGKDTWRSLGTSNRKEAESVAYKIWYFQQSHELQEMLSLPQYGLDLIWSKHLESERFRLLSSSTQKTRERRWNAFKTWAEEQKLVANDLTRSLLIKYLKNCESSNKYYNNVKNDLFQVFVDFYSSNNLPNPAANIESKSVTRGDKRSKDYRAFNDDEIKKILSAIQTSRMNHREEWYYACLISMYTGLRFKDVALLKWTEVKNGIIDTIPAKTENKTQKGVLIKVNNQLAKVFSDMPKTSFYLLPGLAADYDEDKSTKYFMRLLKRLNIKSSDNYSVGFHSFRATVVTKLRASGVDLDKVSGVIGHSSTKQTEHYDKNSASVDMSSLHYKIS